MRRSDSGFTLLELLTVMVIIAILALILIQSAGDLRGRADFAQCLTNLRSLYVGAGSYLQEQGHWPQIDPRTNMKGSTVYAEAWIAAMKPYGIPRKCWVCPTVQRQMNSPDLEQAKNARVDYIATPFDDKPMTPRRWGTQPWFIEKSYSHPGGSLMIFADGDAMPMKEAIRRPYSEQ